jgi:hypothetical protein
MKLVLLFGLVSLTGCATTYNIDQVGPNRYQAESTWGGSIDNAEHSAKGVATKECASHGETLAEMSIETHHDDPANDHAVVTFECR